MLKLYFTGRLSVQHTLHTMFNTHCTHRKIHIKRLVQYTLHTLYNTHSKHFTIHTAHLVQLSLAGRLNELGS